MVNNVYCVNAQMKLAIANKFSVGISNDKIHTSDVIIVVPFCVISQAFLVLVRCSNIHIHEGTTISLPGTHS